MYHLAPELVHTPETFGNTESGERMKMAGGAVPLLLKSTAVPSVRKILSLREATVPSVWNPEGAGENSRGLSGYSTGSPRYNLLTYT